MKKRAVVLFGIYVLLVCSINIYGAYGHQALEEARTAETLSAAGNSYDFDRKILEEMKTDYKAIEDSNDSNLRDVQDGVEVNVEEDTVQEIAQDVKPKESSIEGEPEIESEVTAETETADEEGAEELVAEKSIIEEETIDPEPIPMAETAVLPVMEKFNEIFIKEEIRVVESPKTKEEFEAILLNMCQTNAFTYSMEYEGVDFHELLSDEMQTRIAEAFDSIFNKYPEYMSFTNRMTYKAKGEGDKVTITFVLSSETGMDEETLITYREAFFEESEGIVSGLETRGLLYEGQTNREKALVLFDWVVQNSEYDNDFHAESYTGYGVYENGLGVCQGYTAAYNALCKIAGLWVEGVGGIADGGEHIWTRALFAGEDTYIDVTWGDSYVNSDASNYDFFFVSGDALSETHTW